MYLGRYQESLEHFTQALAIRREIGDRAGESRDLANLGALEADQGHYAAARGYYEQALALQTALNEPETLWRLWNNLRQSWSADAQPGPAIVAGKRAVNTIQAMRAASSGLERAQQQSFLEDKEDVYLRLADLLLAQDRPAEAQQVLDMLKEQEFYDYIQEDDAHDPRTTRAAFNRFEADWNAGYDGIAEPLPALGERIAALSRIDASARTAEEQAELERLTAERDAATAELERLLTELPQHFAAIDPAQQAEANEALAKAPGNKRALLAALSEQGGQPTGLLQFILLGDKVRLLLTTPADWHTAVVEVDADTLNTEIDALRSALTDRYSDATTPAKALYTRLVAPIAEAIDAAGLQSLLVHLDGKLRYIPFAALHDGEQWLAERWSLVYYTAASERQPEAAGGGDWRVAGLGVSEQRQGFSQLKAVKDEIDGIVREDAADPNGVLPGRALLNAAFSETALRTEAAAPANRILHLASHFDLHPGSDADSSLLLGTVADDGQPHTLSLKALRESKPPLDLRHIDLVTLSACNTFMGGADDTGVEIEGMGTIIQRQGARGVLASLWPVADASTGELMQTFYRLRAEQPALSKAQALQQAQLALLQGADPDTDCAAARMPVYLGTGETAGARPRARQAGLPLAPSLLLGAVRADGQLAMKSVDARYERLRPRLALLRDEAVLAQAWKKAERYSRCRNRYADVLAWDLAALIIESGLERRKPSLVLRLENAETGRTCGSELQSRLPRRRRSRLQVAPTVPSGHVSGRGTSAAVHWCDLQGKERPGAHACLRRGSAVTYIPQTRISRPCRCSSR